MVDFNELWEEAKAQLALSMNITVYEVWVDKLKPVCFSDSALVLSTITLASKRTIETRYLDTIRDAVRGINPAVTDVVIATESECERYLSNSSVLSDAGFMPIPAANKAQSVFLEKYTFDNFVEGKSNKFAFAACKAVAEELGVRYNPLFIYSGVGLGKTHLLHAIGNHLGKYMPHKKVLYVSAENLMNELISVIRTKSDEENSKFREKYRSVDVLMVDDIQFLIGKEATQDAFFHIFNDLYQNNKQIIITSDRAPKELAPLAERLTTRFTWGLTADIQPPDLETRIAILQTKAAQAKFVLADEVAQYIAESCTSNIREMEGLLNKIVFFSSLTNTRICTKELAKEALRDAIDDTKSGVDASDIIETTCRYFKISKDDIFSSKRTKAVVEPRMIAIYLITDLLPVPLVQIGQMFGGKDHTTIIHARDKISEEVKSNPRVRIIVADIKNMLMNR